MRALRVGPDGELPTGRLNKSHHGLCYTTLRLTRKASCGLKDSKQAQPFPAKLMQVPKVLGAKVDIKGQRGSMPVGASAATSCRH